jgi:hypothetical protein
MADIIEDIIGSLSNNDRIIPMIGFELLPIKLSVGNKNNGNIPYLEHLARKIAAANNIGTGEDIDSPVDLFNNVMHKLLIQKAFNQLDTTKELCRQAKLIHDDVDTSLLEKIVQVRPFKYFLNLTFTTHLQEFVNKFRKYPGGTVKQSSFPYLLKDIQRPEDLIKDSSKFEAVIYNLCGLAYDSSVTPILNYYYSDDHILAMTSDVTKRYDVDLKNLKETITTSSLLFLGCQFPDWLLRYFIYTLKPNSFNIFDSISARVFVDYCNDNSTSFFLTKHSFKFQKNQTTFNLINNLYAELLAKNFLISTLSNEYAFISYSSEDLPLVKKIVDQCFNCGMNLWFDRIKLFPGSMIDEEVKEGIRNCKVFLPLVTDKSKNKKAQDYVRQEWIYYHDKFKEDPKVIPLVLTEEVDTGNLNFNLDSVFGTPGSNVYYIPVTGNGLCEQDVMAIKTKMQA